MSFWQRFAVVALGLATAIIIQLVVKDADARVGLTSTATMLIGWMLRSPGDAPAPLKIPPPSRVPTFPETPEAKAGDK